MNINLQMDMNNKKIVLLLSAALLLFPSISSEAKFKLFFWKKDKVENTDTVKVKKPSKYDKLFKDESKRMNGMFTLHLKKGKVYFEIPDSLLGRQYVMGSTIKSTSDNANGVVGSKPLELKHFTFVKVDSSIQMRSINCGYFSMDSNIESALAQGNTGYVEKSFKIKAYNNDSTSVVFDATSIFLSDDKQMSPFSEIAPNAYYEREDEFKSDLSYITDIKAFDDNVSVSSSMSYNYSLKDYMTGKYKIKNAPFTAELTRSILLLPEQIYHPRMADYRIGVFFTQRDMLGSTGNGTKPVYFANRWRIEPSDVEAYKRGELVEPLKPIVWYVDNNFPQWWKPYIFEAVEQWNELFEEIGFKNVMRALPFPENDPSFDPDNIRYNCIRYAPINVQNATGPSWVDPRSGEIINASVYVYHDIIKLINRWRFVQTAAADSSVRTNDISQEITGDALRYVITHEIGHTLGFMHNMSGSSVIPVEDLRSSKSNGTTTTIMDYARFNYVAQPGDKEKGASMTPPRFGDYDRWLVKWTYTPIFDLSFEQEAELTSDWITEALAKDEYYRYGKQQFSFSLFDPRSQTEDLGDDAVKATKYGVSNLKYITKHFMDWLSEGDDEYEHRMAIYNSILNQYVMYAQHVALNVGGLYKNEIKYGDGQAFRYKNIPFKKQKEALNYLFKLWEDTDWIDSKEFLSKLPVVGSPKRAVQKNIEELIMILPILQSTSDGVESHQYSSVDCLWDISNKIFSPSLKGSRLSAEQRSFQSNFVYTIMNLGSFPIPGATNSFVSNSHSEHIECSCSSCWTPELDFVSDSVRPISGFEWFPRYIFNMNSDLTKANLYAVLKHVSDIMTNAKRGANSADKIHYETLIECINYSTKK